MMECKGRDCYHFEKRVRVYVPADLSHDGVAHDKVMGVDACIADLVEKLYPLTAASCCGHGQTEGRILLHDGRVLKIFNNKNDEGAMPDGPWGYSREAEMNDEISYADFVEIVAELADMAVHEGSYSMEIHLETLARLRLHFTEQEIREICLGEGLGWDKYLSLVREA